MSKIIKKNYIGAFLVMLFALLLNISAFAAAQVAVKIPIGVTLEGERASSEQVTVTMTPLDGAPEFDETSITLDAKKGERVEAQFTKTFAEPVNLRYEIRETAGTTDAYTYDDTVYTAVVFVENDFDKGGLKASVVKVYKDDDSTTKQDAADFVNKYEPAFIDPPITKVVTNDSGTAPDTAKFHFTMKAEDKTSPMPLGSNDGQKTIEAGAGAIEFGEILYEKAGTYIYKVTEEKENLSYFTYDETTYTVKAEVEKVNGKLTATYTINDGTKDVTEIRFDNHYNSGTGTETRTGITRGTTGGGNGSGGGGGGGSSTGGTGVPAGSVLGAVREAVENSPVGQVLGAAREKVENSPVGKVLGATRGAVRTGDNSIMTISAICFLIAVAVLIGWSRAYMKRRL